ncbi:hypothetical protein D9611_010590 [Ephemerocybe angulata]|uniref:Cytochrome P450 n=1 Tax=Ephemerocybe angulata TaxID=980116 RepID=A0A8H5FBF3_9AGAR|nr:hypothetical protein D9611_010590 [Tulosesus angulatus]
MSDSSVIMPLMTTLGFFCTAYLLSRWQKSKRGVRSLPLPPGPKRLPVLGNLLQLPQVQPWEEYNRMSQEFGDIMYLEALGQPIVLLNSLSRATEVYDKRGVQYSDRPHLPILGLMEMDWSFGLMPYGSEWKRHRKPFHQLVNANALPKFYPVFNEEMRVLLQSLHKTPEEFLGHMKYFFGAVIMRLSYGFDDVQTNKALIQDAEILMQAFSEAALPGRYLVNHLPVLKWVPEWFPGAAWKKHCRYIATVNYRTLYDSFESVKANLKKGVKSLYPSMAVTLLEEMPEEEGPERRDLESIARISCASGYAAGADTTVSSAVGLVHILATHPEVQKKAQQEIDSVTGGKRLPLMSDRDNLPYVSALIKELGRWYTVVPLGLAHVAAEDAEYDGYYIPKGTFVMTNAWSILHDPEVYENPMEFKPERFLKDGQIDPTVLDPYHAGAFGYGRRVCPGRALSTETLFLTAACLLSTFDISPPKDEAGRSLPMKLETLSQVIASPLPFKCDIKLRSESHAALFKA